MGLILPSPIGLPPAIDAAFDEVIAPLQTWAGKVDGFGKFLDVPYDVTNFSTDSGTWTVTAGDQLMFKFAIVGDMMHVAFNFVDTTLSGVGNELRLRIPDGWAATSQEFTGYVRASGTTAEHASVVTRKSTLANHLSIQRLPAASWADATDQVLRGSIWLQVHRV